MKRAVLPLLVSVLVIVSTIAWLRQVPGKLSMEEWSGALVILVLAALGIAFAFQRLQSARRGEPLWDELSRRMMEKASSMAFYGSIYMWLAVMLMKDKVQADTEVLIGTGILGMSLIWLLCVIYVRIKGLKNE